MINLLLAAAMALPAQDPAPVELLREFKKGDFLTYQVKSHLLTETKTYQNPVFMPSIMDLEYKFTIDVKDIKADGFADIVYKRPTMTITTEDGGEAGLKTSEEKTNLNMGMTLSPINEITNVKDLNPPEKPEKPKAKPNDNLLLRLMAPTAPRVQQIPFLGEFLQDLYRLALCTGSLDSALDLAPKLPYEEVEPGDTWKRTVSYQPQKLKGADGKTVVQRLDYTFVYDGLVAKEDGKFHQVTASLNLDTDIGTFINQYFNATAGQTGIKSIPLKLQSKIVFLLDEKTKNTVKADAESKGEWKIMLSVMDTPYQDEKITGRTSLRIVPKK